MYSHIPATVQLLGVRFVAGKSFLSKQHNLNWFLPDDWGREGRRTRQTRGQTLLCLSGSGRYLGDQGCQMVKHTHSGGDLKKDKEIKAVPQPQVFTELHN